MPSSIWITFWMPSTEAQRWPSRAALSPPQVAQPMPMIPASDRGSTSSSSFMGVSRRR